jgi:V8-like Glu-specific endopeptidase
MIRKLSRVVNVIVGIAMLAILFLGTAGEGRAELPAAPRVAPVEQTDGSTVSTRMIAPEWTAAKEPWTKEEMLAAKPYPMPDASGEPQYSITADEPAGAPGKFASAKPATGGKLTLLGEGDEAALSFAAPLGYSYPAPFTRYKNFQHYGVFPYVTVGKLFFRQQQANYVCSAASIGNYAIWTAGHCVAAGNGVNWSTNVVFVPAYRNGTAPYGQWTGAVLWTTNAWFYNEDLRYDFGGVVLNTLGGSRISQRVGNLGFAYNQSRNLAWFLLGYPQAAPFDGRYQHICASSYAYSDASFGSPYTNGVGCDQTGGTSGGPWVWKFSGNAGATNYLNGNNSYRYVNPNHPLELFSPYIGTDAYNLWWDLTHDTP